MGLLWIIALLPGIGLFWYLFKSLASRDEQRKMSWPRREDDIPRTVSLLANHDPWEVAFWLLENFAGKEDLWPSLRAALQEHGYEGIYLAALGQAGRRQEGLKQELALGALGLIGTARSLPLLLEALADKDEKYSLAACQALKRLKLPESAQPLVESLTSHERILPARSAEILLNLGRVGMTAVAQALEEAGPPAKLLLIETLGEFKDDAALPVLLPHLADSEGEVRCKVVEALGNLSSSRVTPYLIEALEDSYWKVRAAAAKALGRLSCKAAIPTLKTLCGDEKWHVRTNAREALEQMGVTVEVQEEQK